jgi:hypothetical protein
MGEALRPDGGRRRDRAVAIGGARSHGITEDQRRECILRRQWQGHGWRRGKIKNATTASICGNHLTGNGGDTAASSAQIYFDGTNDGIGFCGNVYGAESQTGDATLKPSYVYDANPGTVLTNSNLYENPAPQVLGVYTTAAAPILAPLQVPQPIPTI